MRDGDAEGDDRHCGDVESCLVCDDGDADSAFGVAVGLGVCDEQGTAGRGRLRVESDPPYIHFAGVNEG